MSWTQGTNVVVDDSGTVTAGSGQCLALYQKFILNWPNLLNPAVIPPYWRAEAGNWATFAVQANVRIYRYAANIANGVGNGYAQECFGVKVKNGGTYTNVAWKLAFTGATSIGESTDGAGDKLVTVGYGASNLLTEAHYKDALASSTTIETPLTTLVADATVSSIVLVPAEALTANDGGYATITFSKRDASGGTKTQLAQVTTMTLGSGGTGDWTAHKPVSMGTITNGTIAAGWSITYEVSKIAAGVVLPRFAIVLQ